MLKGGPNKRTLAARRPAYHAVANVHKRVLGSPLVIKICPTSCSAAWNSPARTIWCHDIDGILHFVEHKVQTGPELTVPYPENNVLGCHMVSCSLDSPTLQGSSKHLSRATHLKPAWCLRKWTLDGWGQSWL